MRRKRRWDRSSQTLRQAADNLPQLDLDFDNVAHFDGETYDPLADHKRLATALGKVWDLMRDEKPRTIPEIAAAVECSETSASARIRDLRKAKYAEVFPTSDVISQRLDGGLWQYTVKVPPRYRKAD